MDLCSLRTKNCGCAVVHPEIYPENTTVISIIQPVLPRVIIIQMVFCGWSDVNVRSSGFHFWRTSRPSSCSWGCLSRRGAYWRASPFPVCVLTLNRSPWRSGPPRTDRRPWCCSCGCRIQTGGSWWRSPRTAEEDWRGDTEEATLFRNTFNDT